MDPMSDPPPSNRSKDPVTARLVAMGTLVTALAGLATAIWKPQDQTVTKAAYVQCTQGIEKLNDGLALEHQELATLRGYISAKDGQSLLTQPVSASVDAGAAAPPPPPPRRAPKPAPVPPEAMLAMPSMAPPPPAPPEPPPATPAPTAFHPVDFDTVLKSAK
jgi:hypothetical protein